MSGEVKFDWTDTLTDLRACPDAVAWARGYHDLYAAWAASERGDWMLWLAGKLSGPPESASRKRLVLAACECARLALAHVRAGEDRPRIAIETAERWARGEAGVTLANVRAAAADAYAAAAADAAAAAAAAYAAAAWAARTSTHAACADIVRSLVACPTLKGVYRD